MNMRQRGCLPSVIKRLKIEINCLADIFKRLAFALSFGHASGKRRHINRKTAFVGRL